MKKAANVALMVAGVLVALIGVVFFAGTQKEVDREEILQKARAAKARKKKEREDEQQREEPSTASKSGGKETGKPGDRESGQPDTGTA